MGEDIAKAHALGNALLVCMIVPWFLCFIFYTGQHLTRSDAQLLGYPAEPQSFILTPTSDATRSQYMYFEARVSSAGLVRIG